MSRWLAAAVTGLILVTAGSGARAGGGGGGRKKPPQPVTTPEPAPPPEPQPPLGEPVPPASDKRLIVGILDVRVEGMPAATADDFERKLQVLAAPHRDRLWLGTRRQLKELLAGSIEWTEGCLFGPCMKAVRDQTRAPAVLTVFLQSMGTTYRHVITVVRTDTGAVVDQRSATCGACTQDEAVSGAAAAALEAVLGVPDKVVDLALADPKAVALRAEAPYKRRLRSARRRTRTTGLVLTGLAAISGGLGGYWLAKDKDHMAGPALGVAAGLVTAGMVSFAVYLTWD